VCGKVCFGFGGVIVFCVWESFCGILGASVCCVYDSLVWVWGIECVLCAGQFGVGFGERVCAVCGIVWWRFVGVSVCCVLENLVWFWGVSVFCVWDS